MLCTNFSAAQTKKMRAFEKQKRNKKESALLLSQEGVSWPFNKIQDGASHRGQHVFYNAGAI